MKTSKNLATALGALLALGTISTAGADALANLSGTYAPVAAPSAQGDLVAFLNKSGANKEVILVQNGTAEVVAATGSTPPSISTPILNVSAPVAGASGSIAFRATYQGFDSNPKDAIFIAFPGGGMWEFVQADMWTSEGQLASIGQKFDFDNFNIIWTGTLENGTQGVFSIIGGCWFTVPALTTDNIPGGSGTFTNFSDVAIDDESTVAFIHKPGAVATGLYASFNREATIKIANTSTLMPSCTGFFQSFDAVTVADGKIYFGAHSTERSGIYKYENGFISSLADSTTPTTDGSAGLGVVSSISVSGDRVVVSAGTDGSIFLVDNGSVRPIVRPPVSNPLKGGRDIPKHIEMTRHAIVGDDVYYFLTDGSGGTTMSASLLTAPAAVSDWMTY